MASIRDVAKEAGVGVGTVSRFLNGSGYVSEAVSYTHLDVYKRQEYMVQAMTTFFGSHISMEKGQIIWS